MAWLKTVQHLIVGELDRNHTIKVNWGPSDISLVDIYYRRDKGKFAMVGCPIVADVYKGVELHHARYVVAWICQKMQVPVPEEPGVNMHNMHAEALSLMHQLITRLEQHIIQ
jgi:hypothetical protein